MGTKIFVIKLKTIIRYALAALITAGVIIGAVVIFSGGSSPTYSPGTYSAQIVLNSNPVSIEVCVDRHSIKSVEMLNLGDTEAVFYPVFNQSFEDIAQQIVSLQSTEGVELSDDNAVTGGIILQAVNTALESAQKK